MKTNKLLHYFILIIILVVCFFGSKSFISRADEFGIVPPISELYTVYSVHTGEVLFIAEYVEVNDEYISENNTWYTVIEVNYEEFTAYAQFKAQFYLPDDTSAPSNNLTHTSTYLNEVIGLYHTHNAESYVPSDGTDSIYGKGGIHDIGEYLMQNLLEHDLEVYYNETLHLPHDGSAYVRSRVTANKLLNLNPTPAALFDIHRDALPKSSYAVTLNGKSASKIRMVVGKSNSNYAYNLEFALKIKATADMLYPGLIKDIYMGANRYNQDLLSNALIFECGTYLIEKEAVLESMPMLSTVIYDTLYSGNISGDILISDDATDNADINPPASDTADTNLDTGDNSNDNIIPFVATNNLNGLKAFIIIIFGFVIYFLARTYNK